MLRNKKWIWGFLVAILFLVPFVQASTPVEFTDGWWGNTRYENGNVLFDFLVPSIGLDGYTVQPIVSEGRAVKGVFIGEVEGRSGECEYNLAAFSLPNGTLTEPAHATMGHCTGELAGMHLVGTATIDYSQLPSFEGPWQGSYHFDPQG